MMVKVVFYLPLKDNDGRDLSREIEDAEANLFILFGSWTFHGYIKGSYQMHPVWRRLTRARGIQ
jgi:hypothetical protein